MGLLAALVPEGKRRLSRQPLSVKANMGALGEVVTIAVGTGVLPVSEVGDGEEVIGEDHAAGDAGTEFLDLTMDVTKECGT